MVACVPEKMFFECMCVCETKQIFPSNDFWTHPADVNESDVFVLRADWQAEHLQWGISEQEHAEIASSGFHNGCCLNLAKYAHWFLFGLE